MTSSEVRARISVLLCQADYARSDYERQSLLIEARRLLNNDLVTAIDAEVYLQHTPEVAICQNLAPAAGVSPAFELGFTPEGGLEWFKSGGSK